MTEIDVTLVERLVAEQHPRWRSLPVRPVPVSGWDNRSFRLGDDLLVRLPSAEGYAGAVAKEQEWLPRLAPLLPLPIPEPVAIGAPALGYPWPWSVYRWLPGQPVDRTRVRDLAELARTLAGFLDALHAIRLPGPGPGQHNWFRGGPVAYYDDQTRQAVAVLGDAVDGRLALDLWQAALGSTWAGPDGWFHGDVADGNLLATGGRLSAVIDFGTSGFGDPACDLTVAWTLLDGAARETFRAAVTAGDGTWARARVGRLEGVDPAGLEPRRAQDRGRRAARPGRRPGRAPRARLSRRGERAIQHRVVPDRTLANSGGRVSGRSWRSHSPRTTCWSPRRS